MTTKTRRRERNQRAGDRIRRTRPSIIAPVVNAEPEPAERLIVNAGRRSFDLRHIAGEPIARDLFHQATAIVETEQEPPRLEEHETNLTANQLIAVRRAVARFAEASQQYIDEINAVRDGMMR